METNESANRSYTTVGELPDYFIDKVMREFTAYSVALGRVRDGDRNPFTPLGSGVFVRRGNTYGILTAHHCLHHHETPVSIGIGGTDRIALATIHSTGRILGPEAFVEHPLAYPSGDYNSFGPDLTFIEILPGERLGSIKAEVGFFSLDSSAKDVAAKWAQPSTLIALIGFPARDYKTNMVKGIVRHEIRHMAFVGALASDSIVTKNGWDYVESTVVYSASNDLPKSFDGVSGGPIWAMQVKKDKNGILDIQDFALIGISFWQTLPFDNHRAIRGHGIQSIYDIAWRNQTASDGVFIG